MTEQQDRAGSTKYICDSRSDGSFTINPNIEDGHFSKILLPQDGSEFARSCVKRASIMGQGSGAQIVVVGCLDLREITGNQVDMSPLVVLKMYEEAKRKLSGQLNEVVNELEDMDIDAYSRIVVGRPAKEIACLARQENADLIMMASRGRRGFQRWLNGSVTEGVVRRSTCPVMVVLNKSERFKTPGLFARLRSYVLPRPIFEQGH
jgi:nucleotide-binding universal stress UspA family protein